jgi:hypothetical protein
MGKIGELEKKLFLNSFVSHLHFASPISISPYGFAFEAEQ